MKAIAELFQSLDRCRGTGVQTEVLSHFFATSSNDERVWALYLLCGHKPRKHITNAHLKLLAGELAGIPPWLMEDSLHAIGELAETVALIFPPPEIRGRTSAGYWIEFLQRAAHLDEADKKLEIGAAWRELTITERTLFNRLLLGTFRPPVSRALVWKVLASLRGANPAAIAYRLEDAWHPGDVTFDRLIAQHGQTDEAFRPYPFCLAHPLVEPVESLGDRTAWQAEWMWDGVRAQLINRGGKPLVWSRNEDLLTQSLPELARLAHTLPSGVVLDGQITVHGRVPPLFMAFDIVEIDGEDIRHRPLSARRGILERLQSYFEKGPVQVSPLIECDTWENVAAQKEKARARGALGVMLKRTESPYGSGRNRGDWWKWKANQLSINAVLLYAERANGPRADMYSLFTFAVWHNKTLIPCVKTGSGLTDEEILELDAFIRANTWERFGPVRTVVPALVCEIGFERMEYSKRRKSGVSLRNPRILRWHREKTVESAATLDQLHRLAQELAAEGLPSKR